MSLSETENVAVGLAALRRERLKAWRQLPKVKAAQKAYHQLPKVKARRKAYLQRPEVKAAQKAYYQLPKVKARRKAYLQRPEIKTYIKAYHQLPKVKARTQGSERRFARKVYVKACVGKIADTYCRSSLRKKGLAITPENIEWQRAFIIKLRTNHITQLLKAVEIIKQHG